MITDRNDLVNPIFQKGDRVSVEGMQGTYTVSRIYDDRVEIKIPGSKPKDGVQLVPVPASKVTKAEINFRQQVLTAVEKPVFLATKLEGIPQALKDRDRWMFWGAILKGTKWSKIPKRPCDLKRWAKNDKPVDWSSFSDISEYYSLFPDSTDIDGLYFVLGDGITGIDLDNCVNPETKEIKPLAIAILTLLNTYCEYSPTGTGIKAYVACPKTVLWERLKMVLSSNTVDIASADMTVECYDEKRGFCVTGHKVEGFPDALSSDPDAFYRGWLLAFGNLVELERNKPKREPMGNVECVPSSITDDMILARARAAQNGEKFSSLFDDGDTSDYGNDASRADQALLTMLAFYVGDDEHRLDRLFEKSALMRDKWKGSYRRSTLTYAINSLTETYSWYDRSKHEEWLKNNTKPKPSEPIEEERTDEDMPYRNLRFEQAEQEKNKQEKGPDKTRGFRPSEIRAMPEPKWLVEDHIVENSLCGIFGPPASFKSFYGFDLAFSIATGLPFLGRFKVEQAPISYVYAEGTGAIARRMIAWEQYRGVQLPENETCIIPYSYNLTGEDDESQADELVRVSKEILSSSPRIVVIDTLSRCFGPGDENSTKDMKAFVSMLDRIKSDHRTVIVVHHTGKDKTRKERGSNVFRASFDSLISIDRADGTTQATVKCEKQKDAEEFPSYFVEATKVDINRGSSLILNHKQDKKTDRADEKKPAKKLSKDVYYSLIFNQNPENAISVNRASKAWNISLDAARARIKTLVAHDMIASVPGPPENGSGGEAKYYYITHEGSNKIMIEQVEQEV